MPSRTGSCHVAKITRRYNGKQYVTYVLRRSYRQGGKVLHETLGNLSHLPEHVIEIIRRSLRGESFVPAGEAFRIIRSLSVDTHEDVRGAVRVNTASSGT